MTDQPTIKKYPTTTSEVAEMLGIHGVKQDLPMGTFADSHSELPVANLPIAIPTVDNSTHNNNSSTNTTVHANVSVPAASAAKPQNKLVALAKVVGPFVAVFIVGIFLYYFFFSTVNFNSVLSSKTPAPATPKETILQQLEAQDSVAYKAWIQGFYYDVNNSKILDPEADNSGNGLTNFQKYLLNLNPKSYDTLGLGMSDSQAMAQGINPLTGGQLTTAQKSVMDKYVDMEVTMNRLALYNLQNPGQVAGIAVNSNGSLYNKPVSVGLNTRGGSNNSQPYAISPLNDSNVDINTNIPARLEIPDLKINVPIIWSADPKNFDQDLQRGVIHYPGTALPGEIGTTYIAGHSSNYVWAKGDFNQVFTHLGDLANNTSFKITVVQKNGKDAVFNYVVSGRQEYAPTDQAQFQNSDKSVVALSTCWPIGSTAKRLVVFGTLTQVTK